MHFVFRFIAVAVITSCAAFSAQAAEMKIGAVNVTRLFSQAPQADQARKKLEKEFGPSKRELEALQEDIVAKQEKLQRDNLTMKKADVDALSREIVSDTKELRRRSEDFQEAFSRREKELFVALQAGVFKTIVNKAEKENYDLIVGEGVIYAREQVDLTDALLKQLEKDFKSSK